MRLTIFLTENVKNRPATSQYSEAIESRGGEMTLFHKSFFAQRSTRISAAATVCLYMFLAACPTPGAAQGASTRNALRLLGKFAVTVAANVATSIASDEAKAAIHPAKNANGNATSIASDEAKAAIHPEQNANGNATSQITNEAPPQVSGYTFTLTWQSDDGIYLGTLVMQGVTGYFRVNAPDATGIDQDMIAVPRNGYIYLIGSNPRYAGSAIPAYYSPDNFVLTQLSDGEWSIASTCDDQGRYAPVAVIDARAF